MQKPLPRITYPEIKRLGSYLVEAGLLTQVQIDVALADQAATGMRFGDILVLRGWIKEQTVEYFMNKLILPEREVAKANSLPPEPGEELPPQPFPVLNRTSRLARQKLFSDRRISDTWLG